MVSLQPVKAESLSTQVAEKIRQAIFSRELKPGETLRELVLARKMEVSQATVREALSYLETYGLVIRTPNRSTSVTTLSPSEIRDRIIVRQALEALAFAEAGKAASDADWTDIAEMAANLRSLLRAPGEELEIWAAERMLCRRLWQLSSNPLLARILDQTTTPLYALWDGRQIPTVEALDRLMAAIRSGDRTALEASHAAFLAPVSIQSAQSSAP